MATVRGHLFTKTNPVRERRTSSPTLEISLDFNCGFKYGDVGTKNVIQQLSSRR
jgi:2-oxoglutarate dehydrogenase E1 component